MHCPVVQKVFFQRTILLALPQSAGARRLRAEAQVVALGNYLAQFQARSGAIVRRFAVYRGNAYAIRLGRLDLIRYFARLTRSVLSAIVRYGVRGHNWSPDKAAPRQFQNKPK